MGLGVGLSVPHREHFYPLETKTLSEKPQCPLGPDIGTGMSNFDLRIDEGFAEALQAQACFGRHAGWNFNGRVFWAGGAFWEEVWVFGTPRGVLGPASDLMELMERANNQFGWD
jgi:hypothetical protein